MIRHGLLALLPGLTAVLAACTSDLSPVQPVLEPVTIRIADSEPQDIRIPAPSDAPILITVAGQNVDVKAAIRNSGTSTTEYANAPNRRMGVEDLLVEPPHDGIVILRIARNDHREARGIVNIKAIALPMATDADRRRLEAARLLATACLAYPVPAKANESADAFAAAAKLQHEIGDSIRFGTALLHEAGARYTRLGNWSLVADLASRALIQFEEAGAPDLAAFAMRLQGAALNELANSRRQDSQAHDETINRARQQFTEAARRFQSLGLAYEAGYAFNYRGVTFADAGESDNARADFRMALQLFRKANDKPAQALSLQSLAMLSHEDGRLTVAMREFDEALSLIPRDEEPENYAHTLHNSALPLQAIGRFDEAIARYFEARNILHNLGDRNGEARALQGMGTALVHAGESERAKEMLQAAITLRQETGSRREQAVALVALGHIERQSHNVEIAIDLHLQAAQLAQAPVDRARVLLALAQDYLATDRHGSAREALREILSLQLSESNRHRGLALTELGTLESLQGNRAASERAFADAIAVFERNGLELDQARALQRRGEAELMRGDMKAALSDADAALALFESVGIAGTQAESRAAFRSSYRGATELRIAALLQNADLAHEHADEPGAQRLLRAAFATSDRARAHLLADNSAVGFTTHGIPADLLAKRWQLYESLSAKRRQQQLLLDGVRHDVGQLEAIEKTIALLRAEAALVESQIAQRQAGFVAVTSKNEIDVIEGLPAGVRVVEYFIGNRQGWLFDVQDGVVAAYEIGDLAQLDSQARRLHDSWQSPAAAPTNRYTHADSLARSAFGPLVATVRPQRLRIVADGALHLVPMAWLATRIWPGMKPGSVVVIPSVRATQLDSSRRRDRPEMLIAVVADPVLAHDDPRLRTVAAVKQLDATAASPLLTRTSRDIGSMRRLPSAAVEAREIAAIADGDAGVLSLLGLDATRSRIESAALDQYRILHFATHAVADSRDPALAMLALSRWDVAGEPVDGALRLHDISQWQLNADLVVLSGCETAVGREIAGEGPIGLSQAFFQAGALSVVATLWQVPDSSTAFLMREFYRHLLSDKQSSAVSLQLAQDAVRRQPKWADPYYWAGLQLVSVEPIDLSNRPQKQGSNDER